MEDLLWESKGMPRGHWVNTVDLLDIRAESDLKNLGPEKLKTGLGTSAIGRDWKSKERPDPRSQHCWFLVQLENMCLNQTHPDRKMINVSFSMWKINLLWIIITVTLTWQITCQQLPSQILWSHSVTVAQLHEMDATSHCSLLAMWFRFLMCCHCKPVYFRCLKQTQKHSVPSLTSEA